MGAVTDIAMLVDGLCARGARFRIADGKVMVEAPAGVIGPEQLVILRDRKREIVNLLTSAKRASRCPGTQFCAGCYEVRAGVWMHPPKVPAWFKKWQPDGTEKLQ